MLLRNRPWLKLLLKKMKGKKFNDIDFFVFNFSEMDSSKKTTFFFLIS